MNIYRRLTPLFFRLDPEVAHTAVTTLWRGAARVPGAGYLTAPLRYDHPALRVSVAGIAFANPLGLAGGFDKDARYIESFARLGFGFIEVGTVTPRPQDGNPRPRLFRLREDRALVNRMGFNNGGIETMARHLRSTRRRVPIGVNIGKNKTTPPEGAASDYLACFKTLAPLADYIAVNVSSPNTPGLRDLQRGAALAEILAPLRDARDTYRQATEGRAVPIFVKLSPDETFEQLDAALQVILDVGIDGIIATNTTTERAATLRSQRRNEQGGLSGTPLFERSTEVLRHLYRALDGRLPIIGVGGVDGPETAYAKILAGASLVQLYTALIYEGPTLVGSTLRGITKLLQRDGFRTVSDAVGQEARR
ncbi:MAG: quinone-dependent dihydroorotate dehydrogenase [Anaerolineae bacterium]